MAKVHLRANKLTGDNYAKPFCATRYVNGKCQLNSRSTYRFMASKVVSFAEFRDVPAADRCAHCVDVGLAVRNRLRKERGFPPVNDAFVDKE